MKKENKTGLDLLISVGLNHGWKKMKELKAKKREILDQFKNSDERIECLSVDKDELASVRREVESL